MAAQMNSWTIMAPHVKVSFRGGDDEFLRALSLLPGVKAYRGGGWLVPENALAVVDDLQRIYGVEVTSAEWVVKPPPIPKWEIVRTLLEQGGELRPSYLDGFLTNYQMDSIRKGWFRQGYHLWIPTGAGKTIIALVMGLSEPGTMVVVTRSSSKLQYAREINRFLTITPYVLKPASNMRKKDISLEQYLENCKKERMRPIIVVGWDSLADQFEQLQKLKIGSLIFDESHNGKNQKRWDVAHLPELPEDAKEAQAQIKQWEKEAKAAGGFVKEVEEGRFKMFLPVINRASIAARLARLARKRITSTATVVKDRVRDMWAQLDLAEPNAWGNATAWLTRYASRRPGKYGGFDTTGQSNLDELATRIQPGACILTYEETHSDLPPKRRASFYVAPEDQVMEGGGFKKLLNSARGPSGVLEARLMQAASRKRKAVLGLVQEHLDSDHKIVLFTGRRQDCNKLGEDVSKMADVKKRNIKVWVAHGDSSLEDRDAIVQEYMAHPGPCVLVGTGHAFGEAINLDTADAAIFVMLPLTPGQLRQWEGRFSRRSSKKPVIIYYAIAEGTVDEHWASVLINKLPAVEKIVNDKELASAEQALSGWDDNTTDAEFAESILSNLDFGLDDDDD